MKSRPVCVGVLPLAACLLTATAAVGKGAPPIARGGPNSDSPIPIVRGGRVSGVARHPAKPPPGGGGGAPSVCSTPGGGNYKTNCHGTGRPVNEAWIATNGSMLVAGANDYNSYNGQGQDGLYWSPLSCGQSWYDAGPIDIFPHARPAQYDAAGDPGLAFDPSNRNLVYYSSLFFNFTSCKVGGVELMRGTFSSTNNAWSWNYYQIAANSSSQFQDKPAVSADSSNVYVSWTQFGSCSGSNVPSPIMVAVFPTGSNSVAPSATFSMPGSHYSQGSSIAADGSGGFWIAWEEYPSASASTGQDILLSHCSFTNTGWTCVMWDGSPASSPNPITEQAGYKFKDLQGPLPGFSFRTDSFPALTVVSGEPQVVWTAYNAYNNPPSSQLVGRAYLWSPTSFQELTPSLDPSTGNDQFFPAIAPNPAASPPVFVSFSQLDAAASTYDSYLWDQDTGEIITSTAPSVPSNDAFFSGQFIGDYNGMAALSHSQNASCGIQAAHPIWTDIRSADPNYAGWEMDAMALSE
jgi:hypothetical protein